jgi:transposase
VFSREFKLEAVKLVTERGVAVLQASRDLDVAESVLRRWIREALADTRQASPATARCGQSKKRSTVFAGRSPSSRRSATS